jgi:asparagine synthase (glutamine-hydrolysing)
MCGILGIFSLRPLENINWRCKSSLESLRHRGPDDSGIIDLSGEEFLQEKDANFIFGHTRLSIIDVSGGGHQPMDSIDGRFTIVFNGEIYNYRELKWELTNHGYVFFTESDTEVLVTAWSHWGVNALKRLKGMFAFAVFDRKDQSVTIARDAFGIKPLFYHKNIDGFSFASEMPALLYLLAEEPDVNLHRSSEYLIYGSYDNAEDTFYEGISHLLPGHWMRFDLAKSHWGDPIRWWWPSIEERSDLSFSDAANQLRDIFLDNVKLHLRSDVPLGAALSGGIDSSAVVCAMRHLEPDMPIHTFSYVARGSAVNEESWVDLVNDHVKAIPHKVIVDPEDLSRDLEDMVRSQGEPFGGTSIYAQYRVYRLARESGITVTLDGQGADELLAGYSGYPNAYMRSLLERKRYLYAVHYMHKWSQWPGRDLRTALAVLYSLTVPESVQVSITRFRGRRRSSEWLNSEWLTGKGVDLSFMSRRMQDNPDGKNRRLVDQLRSSLTGNGLASLLRHGDRNSMRWSVESRVPFLTTEMAEFLLTMPESYLLSGNGETKHIFRAAMRGIVPDVILDRRDKIGFQTPESSWMKGQSAILGKLFTRSFDIPFLDTLKCRRFIENVISGREPYTPQVWYLINYHQWILSR